MPPTNPVSRTAPITSLAFLGRTHLLAGEATCVNIFTLPASASSFAVAPPRKKRVLDRDRIHGIVSSADESTILFWGGRSIALAAATSVLADDEALVKPEIKAPDWVLSAAFLSGGDVVAVGAHNEILVYTRSSNDWATVSCGSAERTMLYAADIFVGCGGEVTVAAGTVFGEIIVWSWNRGAERGRILKRFRGHEGSVFAVRFEAQARWLGSCSDDRTVRVWDLVSTEAEEEAVERETTGFGEVKGEAKGGRGCVAMGWGHQARPWGVRFLPEEDGEVRLASVSEDLTARFWGFIPKMGETALMETRGSWMLHQGKSIWAFALDYERKLMATGGNDGRVGILDYSDNAEIHEEWALEEVVPPVPVIADEEDDQKDEPEPAPGKKVVKKKKNPRLNAFRGYAVVDRERFVATTVYGQIVLYTIPDKTWRILGTWEGLKNWSTVTAWQGTGILAIGDNEGQLGILDIDNGREWWWDAGGRGKVADLFVGDTGGGAFPFVPILVDSPAYGPAIEKVVDYLQVLTTSVAASSFVLHSIRLQDDGPPIRNCLSLLSPAPQKFVATSALITKSQVFLGSRSGDLAIYSLPGEQATGELVPESYHPALYCDDTITSLYLAPTSPPTLATASFSGVYTTHTLPSLTTTNISKPGNVTVITGLFFSPSNDLHIFGFRGTRFIVHNTSTAADTLSVECGGAHRSWKFSPDVEAPWFVWLQAGKVHLHRSFHPRHQVLKHGAHGREIKTAAYCPSTRLLATGAEDTTIRITTVTADGAIKEEGAVMVKKHTTGVLRLVWSEDGERLFSSGGVEELFVFRVRPGPVIGVVLESTLPVPPSEAETRICGLDVISTTTPGPRSYIVATAMSDGHIKVWLYNPSSGAWAVMGHAVYGACCLLQAKFLPPGGDNGNLSLLVAATDGHLAVYDLRPNGDAESRHMDRVWHQRVHQSGVKALSLAPSLAPASSEVTILTGGDDCAIASTTASRAGGQWETKECKLVERAHAAAVISVLPLKNGRAVTMGVDQKIKLWSRGKEGLESRGGVGSMVADPGAAVVVDGDGEMEVIVATGVGIESWRFDGV
jgi:WD40 repeat protein